MQEILGATPAGTRSYFSRFPHLAKTTRAFGRTGWEVSHLGFGTYRTHSQDHAKALQLALQNGVNLIDTSSNYGNGHSERLVGETLHALFHSETLKRENVVLVSKVGFLDREQIQDPQLDPETLLLPPGSPPELGYCISPSFIASQLTETLKRLQVQQLDTLLLHNPEILLRAGLDQTTTYQKIRSAFLALESEVQQGRIQFYGISSNSIVGPTQAPDFISLDVLLELAEQVREELQLPKHHFQVLEFPFNLFEIGAAFESNHSGKSVTEFAVKHGLATLANRPLNAYWSDRLIRLADVAETHPADEDLAAPLKNALMAALRHEQSYLKLPDRPSEPSMREIAWGHRIRHSFESISELETWRSLLEDRIRPSLQETLAQLEAQSPTCAEWARTYRPLAENLFTRLSDFLEEQAAVRARRIALAMDAASETLRQSGALFHKAVRTYSAIPGLDCILVGMRKVDYVFDSLAALDGLSRLEPLTSEEAVEVIESVQERMAEEFQEPLNETTH